MSDFLAQPLPTDRRVVIEASAGTGKTYALAVLLVRHVAERRLAPSQVVAVTYTRLAAAELQQRTRQMLRIARQVLTVGRADAGHAWAPALLACDAPERAARLASVRRALASIDEATITTIHGFCQQALRALGLRSGSALDGTLRGSLDAVVSEACADMLVGRLAPDATALDTGAPSAASKHLEHLVDAVKAVLENPGAVLLPRAGQFTPARGDARLDAWLALVDAACAEVRRRLTGRGEQAYIDLVRQLRDALVPLPDKDEARRALRQRYGLVLVDEFQDTDPLQWEALDAIDPERMVLVGDPKQAIYQFRGANVATYLSATALLPQFQLDTSQRSDADLVRATNTLLEGVQLGDARIRAIPLRAREGAMRRSFPGVPLDLRCLPPPNGATRYPAEDGRTACLDDVGRTIVDLLDNKHLDMPAGRRRVRPSDIVVLVHSNEHARELAERLGGRRVPCVRLQSGSVLLRKDYPRHGGPRMLWTRAAEEWRTFLVAMVSPSRAATVRSAASGVFFGLQPAQLALDAPDAQPLMDRLQDACAGMASSLAQRPFLDWYLHVRRELGIVPRLIGRAGGERLVTDLDHVAELIAAALPGGRVGTAHAALRVLEELVAASEGTTADDPSMRRIESDGEAVAIMTAHASKGLEFGIVLVPTAYTRPNSWLASACNAPGGDRFVDRAVRREWIDHDPAMTVGRREMWMEHGARGEALRLLYVSLTRAKHHVAVWSGPINRSEKSAINRLLFDRTPDSTPSNSPPTGGRTPTLPDHPHPAAGAAAPLLDALCARSEHTIGVTQIDPQLPFPAWSPPPPAAPAVLSVAAVTRGTLLDHERRPWSFSAIAAGRDHAVPEEAPASSGADEPESAGLAEGLPAVPSTPPGAPQALLADAAGGKAFGTLIHTVLERVEHSGADLERRLEAELRGQVRGARTPLDVPRAGQGLAAALRTPLGALTGGRCLADIPAADRLPELRFEFPLHSERAARATVAHIGRLLLDHLSATDPQRAYAQSLVGGRFPVTLAGFLQGSLDAVVRLRQAGGKPSFVVLDYKTNLLHRRDATDVLQAYHPDLLPAAMAACDYPLQAVIYSVALHRFLRWRVRDYDPARHLGGIGYLFLRGMAGPDTPRAGDCPYGVFQWHPPAEAILAIDGLLARGSA